MGCPSDTFSDFHSVGVTGLYYSELYFCEVCPRVFTAITVSSRARVTSLKSSVVSSLTRVTSVKFVTNITSIAMKRVKRIRDRLCQREERVYWRSLMGVLGGVDPTWDEPTLLHCAQCSMHSEHCTLTSLKYASFTAKGFYSTWDELALLHNCTVPHSAQSLHCKGILLQYFIQHYNTL